MSEEQFLELKKLISLSTLAIVNAIGGTNVHTSSRERREQNDLCADSINAILQHIAEK